MSETDTEVEAWEKAEKVTEPEGDLGRAEVAEKVNADLERGFVGNRVDPTPNENYGLQTPPDAPTPETDADASIAADKAVNGNRLKNVEQTSAETAEHNA